MEYFDLKLHTHRLHQALMFHWLLIAIKFIYNIQIHILHTNTDSKKIYPLIIENLNYNFSLTDKTNI